MEWLFWGVFIILFMRISPYVVCGKPGRLTAMI